MKECKECREILSYDNFTKSKNVKDGYENKCKKCRNKNRLKYKSKCVKCGKVWDSQKPNSLYCSQKCKPQSSAKRVIVKCSYCGEKKTTLISKANKFKSHYCNISCKNKHYGEMHKGSNSPRFNEELTKEDRAVGRKYTAYYSWRAEVYKRDLFTCQKCGDDKGGNLIAHHIFNYSTHSELRVDIENGITFCKRCHNEYHKTYGNKANNKNQLEEFLNMSIPC